MADVTTGSAPVIRVLGPVRMAGTPDPGEPAGKPAAVLAALALYAGDWVGVDRLAELVWPDGEPPVSAAGNLKTYVWQLRRLLTGRFGSAGPDRIESRPGGYRLRLEPGELDADLAADALERCGRLLRSGRGEEAAERVRDVLALWRGRPYDELADHCGDPALSRLAELRPALSELLADAYDATGRTAEAIDVLAEVTARDPLRELAWARLIETLSRAGRTRDALAAYQRARRAIVCELGAEPGPELTAAHQAALAGGAGSGATAIPHQLPRPVALVGRGNELAAVIEAGRADPAPVLCVHGPAGTGKTALAIAAGHALADCYPDGQLYVDLAGRRDIADVLGRLVRSLTGPGTALPGDADERAALWRSVSYRRRLLLVADGVADAETLRALLPGSVCGLVLATSRVRLTGLDEYVAVPLAGLADDDVAELWLRRTGVPAARESRESLRRCAGNPGAVLALADQPAERPGRLAALSQEGSWVA